MHRVDSLRVRHFLVADHPAGHRTKHELCICDYS